MGDVRNILAACAVACLLGGCGVAEQIVGGATTTVLGQVNAVATQANYSLQGVNQTVSTVANEARATSTQMAANVQSVAASSQSVAASSQSVSAALPPETSLGSNYVNAAPQVASIAPQTLTSAQKAAIEKNKNAPQPNMPVLPKDTLDTLTVDQKGLQDAAQLAALNGPVGDVLSWDDEGRSGSASTEYEHKLGDTMCREWIEKVTVDGKTSEAHGTACREDEKSHWVLSF